MPAYPDKSVYIMSKWIMLIGAIIFLTGAILHFTPWLLNWFGRLPGDIRIESERSRIFIPLTSMIIISIVLSILINLFKK